MGFTKIDCSMFTVGNNQTNLNSRNLILRFKVSVNEKDFFSIACCASHSESSENLYVFVIPYVFTLLYELSKQW